MDMQTPGKAKRGRKPNLSGHDRVAALEAELAKAKAEVEQAEAEALKLIGKALFEAMKADDDFKKSALIHLEKRVKSPRDKATLAQALVNLK